MSGIAYNDYIKNFVKHTEAKAKMYMKLVVTIIGIISFLFGFLVENSKSVWQVLVTFLGIGSAAQTGMFTLGMFYPRANSKVSDI